MLCKLCNTRIRPGGSACPNCGSHSFIEALRSSSEATSKLPLPKIADGSATRQLEDTEPLQRVASEPIGEDARGEHEVEVELDDEAEVGVKSKQPVEVELDEPAEVGSVRSSERPGDGESEEKEELPAVRPGVQRGNALGSLDTAGLRSLLAEQPGLLEPGLTIYKSEKGTQLGVNYTSAVGEIDLLAKDASGHFVVVVCAERQEAEQLVSSVLQRIGWVRKHLASGSQQVRGIVLLDRARDDIAYAATAVAGTVSFKLYRVAVRFEDLDF
jgi:hypothetical protein